MKLEKIVFYIDRTFFTIILLGIVMMNSVSCNSNKNSNSIKRFEIATIPEIPASFGTISKGVSAAYCGFLENNLIVGGGCNFPDKPVSEGGKKVFYEDILRYDNKKWDKIGQLPEPLAYGASVSANNRVYWIGGTNSTNAVNHVLELKMENNSLVVKQMPNLPFTLDNFSAAMLDNIIYIVGGNKNGLETNEMWKLEINKQDANWEQCASVGNLPLGQPALVAINNNLFLFGGFANTEFTEDKNVRKASVSQTVWKYIPIDNEWKEVSEYNGGDDNNSLSGGIAFNLDNRYIFTSSGVNKTVFENALNRIFFLKNSLYPNEKVALEQEQANNYLKHPTEWYKFNSIVQLFDTETYQWLECGSKSEFGLAGASFATNGDSTIIFNGEIQPGIRTPKIWKIVKK